MPLWLQASGLLSERGESVGLVPYPRPDNMAYNDPNYRMEHRPSSTYSILKGVSDERAVLALHAIKTYHIEWLKNMGGVNSLSDFLSATAEVAASRDGYDILHPVIGRDILHIYSNYSPSTANEFFEIIGIDSNHEIGMLIVGEALHGHNNAPTYAIHVQQRLHTVTDLLLRNEAILQTEELVINRPPVITFFAPVALAMGNDPADYDFSGFVTILSHADGPIPLSMAELTFTDFDWNTPGMYESAIRVTAVCSVGIEVSANANVAVFDPNSTTPPTFEIRETFRNIMLNENAALINWRADFLQSASDANGVNLNFNYVRGDISRLDVSTPGTYPVTLTISDFAGNETLVEIQVTVGS
jgi:hypothetical protein